MRSRVNSFRATAEGRFPSVSARRTGDSGTILAPLTGRSWKPTRGGGEGEGGRRTRSLAAPCSLLLCNNLLSSEARSAERRGSGWICGQILLTLWKRWARIVSSDYPPRRASWDRLPVEMHRVHGAEAPAPPAPRRLPKPAKPLPVLPRDAPPIPPIKG